MYIRNKKSGVVQECGNDDVIKVCRKDAENYEVTEEKPEQESKNEDMGAVGEKNDNIDFKSMKAEELKSFAKEKGIEGAASLTKEELLAVLKDVV